MRVIFGILFAVLLGLVGARFAGWFVDQLIDTQRFTSPDQVDQFELFSRLGVTAVFAFAGIFVGIVVAKALRSRAFRREV